MSDFQDDARSHDEALLVGNFVKLYGSIVTSSVWGESAPTRIVWLTMLAIADVNGGVAGSVPGLARIANVTIPECEAALAVLEAPDEYSRTEENEGRRIREVRGGWMVLNYKLYRELRTPKQVIEAERKADYRERQKEQRDTTGLSRMSHTEGEGEVEAEVTTHSLTPAREEVPEEWSWMSVVMSDFCLRRENPAAWASAFAGMTAGLGTPGGKSVTQAQIEQSCNEIEQLGGDITPRRFRRVLEQVIEPASAFANTPREGSPANAIEARAAKMLAEFRECRAPMHPNSVTPEGWAKLDDAGRVAMKMIGGAPRVLNASDRDYGFIVKEFTKFYTNERRGT